MSDFMAKLSSYELLNYLLTGMVFVALTSYFTSFNFVQGNVLFAVFVYYLIGMLISRVGSLIVEPILKKSGFVRFAPYKDFIAASAKDSKLETLSEANNIYRSLLAACMCVLLLRLLEAVERWRPAISVANSWVLLLAILLILLFSYRKQTRYVRQRVEANLTASKEAVGE